MPKSGHGFKTVIAAQVDRGSAKFEDNIATVGWTLKILYRQDLRQNVLYDCCLNLPIRPEMQKLEIRMSVSKPVT